MELKTTKQAAETLKRTRSQLHLLLFHYPNLKPMLRSENGHYLWTEEEIQQVATHRASHKRGRPSTK